MTNYQVAIVSKTRPVTASVLPAIMSPLFRLSLIVSTLANGTAANKEYTAIRDISSIIGAITNATNNPQLRNKGYENIYHNDLRLYDKYRVRINTPPTVRSTYTEESTRPNQNSQEISSARPITKITTEKPLTDIPVRTCLVTSYFSVSSKYFTRGESHLVSHAFSLFEILVTSLSNLYAKLPDTSRLRKMPPKIEASAKPLISSIFAIWYRLIFSSTQLRRCLSALYQQRRRTTG